MKFHGIQITEGSNVSNLTVASGTAFPSNATEGELFYRSDVATTVKGLYLYVGGNWDRIASADSITAPNGATFPAAANTGDLFYKDSNDAGEGLYVYNGATWIPAASGSGSTATVTGDVTGTLTIGGSAALTLATVNSNVGSFGSASNSVTLTVNAKGLITAASAPAIGIATSQVTSGTFADARIAQSNVTQHQAALSLAATQLTSGVLPDARVQQSNVTQHQAALSIAETQIVDGTIFPRLNGSETITGSYQYNNPVVVPTPISGSHATTKDYVDQAIAGLSWKNSARVGTTANITLSGTQTIDGIAVVAGNRVLVKNQSTSTQNGIYVVSASAWARATDFDSISPIDEINSAAVFVQLGTVNADTAWTQVSPVVTVGTDAITFTQFSGANTYIAGAGMSLSTNTFNVGTASASRIVVNTDDIDLATVGTPVTDVLRRITTDSWGRVTGTSTIQTADLTGVLDASYVNVSGDTMTGNLTLSGSSSAAYTIFDTAAPQQRGVQVKTNGSMRWFFGGVSTAETGSDAGSDFQLVRYSDAGTQLDTPLQVNRSTGLISTNSSWYFSRNTPVISLNTIASGQPIQIDFRTANSTRWAIQKNNNAETGSNTGSNFSILRYDDTATLLDTPFQITRSTGLTTLTSLTVSGAMTGSLTGAASLNVLKAGDTMSGALTNSFGFVGPLTGNVTGSVSGNAGTATALQTARTINGVSFDGTANITVTAAAGTLTGTTLAANVLSSSLTSVGTLASLGVTGTVTAGGFSGPLTGNVTGAASLNVLKAGDTMSGALTNSFGFVGPLTGNASTATALATSRTFSLSGDATGTTATAFDGTANATIPLTLATVNANIGTFGSATQVGTFLVNAKGLITAASNTAIAIPTSAITSGTFADARIAQSNVTQHQAALTILETQITDGTLLARNAGNETITGNWTFSGTTAIAEPSLSSHAATKSYVDNLVQGLTWKTAVKVGTTANITLSGTQTIDGVAVVVADRVLVKNQSTAAQNGVYVVAASAWTRAADFDASPSIGEVNGAAVFVQQGTTQADTGWVQTAIITTIGTDPMTFVIFSATGGAVARSGDTMTGTLTNSSGFIGPLTGNVTGSVTGASSLNVLKTGDTMTGDLAISNAANGITQLGIINTNVVGNAAASYVGATDGQNAIYMARYNAGHATRGGTSWLLTDTNIPLVFGTNSTERVRITSAGNVGVGVSAPLTRLDVRIGDAFSTVVSDASLNNNTSTVARFSFTTDPVATISAGTGVAIALSPTPNRGETFLVSTHPTTSKDSSEFSIWTSSGGVAGERLKVSSTAISIGNTSNFSMSEGTESLVNIFRQATTGATVVANGMRYTGTANGFASSFSTTWARSAIVLGTSQGAGSIGFYSDPTSAVAAGTDVTPTLRMLINNVGNVGIGTGSTSPAYRAHLASNQPGVLGVFRDVDVVANGAAGVFLEFGAKNVNTFVAASQIQGILNSTTTGSMTFSTLSTTMQERMRITIGGDVGIGTAGPVGRLSVVTAATGSAVIPMGLTLNNPTAYGAGTGLNGVGIRFAHTPTDAGSTGVIADIVGVSESETSSTTGALAFRTRSGVSEVTAERMRIDSAGNVGVGITSTGARIHVDAITAGAGITVGQLAQTASQVNIGIGYITSGRPFLGTNTNSNPLEIGTRLAIESIFVTNSVERMRLAASNSDLGIGGLPNSNGAAWATLTMNGTSGGAVEFNAAGTRYGQLLGNNSEVRLAAIGATQVINFQTAGVNQRMTIAASGQIGMGGNLNGISGGVSHVLAIQYAGGSTQYGLALRSMANTTTAVDFVNASDAIIGNITTGASSVAYNTTSDARLKENIVNAQSASAIVDAIQIREFDWKDSNEHQRYGVIAQELVAVVPEAVHVPADPDRMMSVDYSKLVPLLLKEIQELRARVSALENT